MIQNWTEPENTPLHRVPAQTMMVAFLGIMYCVTAPFFLPVVGLFFSIYYLFFKHNLCYHYMQPYASGQTLWAWLVKNTFICLIISQVILLLGLPTLVEDGGSTDYLRLALLPLPFLSSLQMIRTKAILRQSAKLPVHQPSGSESSKEGALPDENGIFDEKGVVGESLSFMKRTALNLRSPGSESSSRSITFDSPKREKSETNSARKTTKRLNLTNEEARNEVERLVKSGKWRNYQPISIWPQVNEKAAASLIIRRWRENKQVKLRIARRRADEAFGLTAHPSRESPQSSPRIPRGRARENHPSAPPEAEEEIYFTRDGHRKKRSGAYRTIRPRVSLRIRLAAKAHFIINAAAEVGVSFVDCLLPFVASPSVGAQSHASRAYFGRDGLRDARPPFPHARALPREAHLGEHPTPEAGCVLLKLAESVTRGNHPFRFPLRDRLPAPGRDAQLPPTRLERSSLALSRLRRASKPAIRLRGGGCARADPERIRPLVRGGRRVDHAVVVFHLVVVFRPIPTDANGTIHRRIRPVRRSRVRLRLHRPSPPSPSSSSSSSSSSWRMTPPETKLDAKSLSPSPSPSRPPSLPSAACPSQLPPGRYSPPPASATARATRWSSARGTLARGVHTTTGCLRLPPPLSSARRPNASAMRAKPRNADADRAGWNPTYEPPERIIMRSISATTAGRGRLSSTSGDSPRRLAAFAAFFAARFPLGPKRSGSRREPPAPAPRLHEYAP